MENARAALVFVTKRHWDAFWSSAKLLVCVLARRVALAPILEDYAAIRQHVQQESSEIVAREGFIQLPHCMYPFVAFSMIDEFKKSFLVNGVDRDY